MIKLWLPSFICNGNNAVWTCKVGRYSIKVTISIISLSKTMILDPWPFYIILGQVFCTKQFKAFAVASVFHLSLGQLIFRPHPMRLFFSLLPELRYYSTTKKRERLRRKEKCPFKNQKSDQAWFFPMFSSKTLQKNLPFLGLLHLE